DELERRIRELEARIK
nr:Chain A, SIN-ASP-GLU-LEU-GLU-ALA-ARG-ILE-ARG-GLU-LEU-GLU-ALA-ARG-ILE-LYS-NH2 [synthetic construct]1HQJ_B Chain B, SIN-ASP-GLU-LEU-GLU-ALA-ARG-ILE-ARG-GLU-LEU-GLU-ALA-ARG-ILE-LYS-NH2 [synthetic construct]1HQJ_C Chain C, SIN-ASP-GLU-LEU-GLU-ALA-ARG-ILE-ARG-GLU-LEU-GLU-ALA-ARG-ILE-LYS-NH2 [synthetic construct]1HQJ_D Chain D, SIN-ASP-GLU-LEU-GLU-ALA-ARG-ILE-ARG-GLU-LEU-GLU-ALA-ARG-ILE-LYS-NH2 [synthetic construct]1HQJ_E Chain E, SIN-ASP-GLU-LEU-GLU-ALA-ARG-ILE-ARG-GLU-LEU-GLU-ALA-ARG-ILE-LYS-NH2